MRPKPVHASIPLTVLCGLDGGRLADLEAGLLLRGDRLAAVHLDPARAAHGTMERRVVDSEGRSTTDTVELSHDCISCTLRERTAEVVRRLAGTGRYDAVVIRLHPGIEAAPAVAALDSELAGWARVDTVVVDLEPRWLERLGGDTDVAQAGIGVVVGDDRAVADVLASQLDVASVIVRAGPARQRSPQDADGVLCALCPDARVVHPPTVLDLRRTDAIGTATYDAPAQHVLTRGGLLSPRSTLRADPASRLSLVRWRAHGPLHPARLHEALDRLADGVLRSTGRLWLATQPEFVIGWDSAGERLAIGPQARWPHPLSARDARPRPAFGGRHNVIAFFGTDLDPERLPATLDACVLTAAEIAGGPAAWRRLPDPFPTWHVDEGAA